MNETDIKRSVVGIRKIQAKLVQELLNHSLLTLLSGYGVALVVYWILNASSDTEFINSWFIGFSLITVFRLLHLFVSQQKITLDNAEAISRQYLLGATLGGLTWASLILGHDASLPLFIQLFILVTLVGMPVASLASNAFCLPVFLGFSLPILSSLVIWGAFFSPSLNFEFTSMAMLYSILVVGIARRYYITLRNSIERGEENQILIREVKEANAKLLHLAYHDPLTNLSNRRQFEENARTLLEKLGSVLNSLALMLIDVDNFKTVNDTLGHKSGDKLLKEISKRIISSSRQSELIIQGQLEAARIGGDEFIIMYHMEPNDTDIKKLAGRVLSTLTEPMQLYNKSFKPSVSIGIALAPQDATKIEELVSVADSAMYMAKHAGGNRYHISNAT